MAENRIMYYTPGKVSLLLEPDGDPDLLPLPRITPLAVLAYQSVLEGLGLSPLHTDPFQGSTQIPMVRRAGARVLQTLTLQSFKSDIVNDDRIEVEKAVTDVADHVRAVNKLIVEQSPVILDKYRLVAACPEWNLTSLCWGCGGPDGEPQPVSINMRRQFMDASVETELSNLLRGVGTKSDVKLPVRVVLFDSWPLDANGDPFAELINASNSAQTNDRLAAFALGAKISRANIFLGPQYLDPAWEQITVSKRDCNGVFKPEYLQGDHGLFVADIINQIAPDAELVVYRVLNDHGTGRLDGIARAVEHAIQQATPGFTIFNFSLGFGPPLAVLQAMLADPTRPLNSSTWGPDVTDMIVQASPDLLTASLSSLTLAAITHMMALDDVLLPGGVAVLPIAAAGNDSCRTHAPTPVVASPRLPAILESVLGVSANEKVGGGPWSTSNYTNNDDFLPPDDGISALDAPMGLFTRNDGALVNLDRLVSWSGTSFATAVTSGMAARLAAQGRDGANALRLDQVKDAILVERPFVGGPGTPRPRIDLIQL